MKTAADFRNGKFFVKRDAIVYAFLLISIIALFIIFAIAPSTAANGFYVYVQDELVLTVKYGESPVVNNDTDKATVVIDGDDYYVYFNAEKTDYNKITVNADGAKITDSTCSLSRDCVYEPTIKNGGAIYCVPHELKIVPITATATPPLTGENAYVKNA